MKTRREIATIIINRRNAGSPSVMTQELKTQLGSDSFSEALRLGWLAPNMDSGGIDISPLGHKLHEMQNAVNSETPEIGDQATISHEGRTYTGKVAKLNPDGTFSLSFESTDKPPIAKDNYSHGEVKLVKPTAVPGSAMTSEPRPPGPALVRYGPEAPGIG
jgi:hypothetical protein